MLLKRAGLFGLQVDCVREPVHDTSDTPNALPALGLGDAAFAKNGYSADLVVASLLEHARVDNADEALEGDRGLDDVGRGDHFHTFFCNVLWKWLACELLLQVARAPSENDRNDYENVFMVFLFLNIANKLVDVLRANLVAVFIRRQANNVFLVSEPILEHCAHRFAFLLTGSEAEDVPVWLLALYHLLHELRCHFGGFRYGSLAYVRSAYRLACDFARRVVVNAKRLSTFERVHDYLVWRRRHQNELEWLAERRSVLQEERK